MEFKRTKSRICALICVFVPLIIIAAILFRACELRYEEYLKERLVENERSFEEYFRSGEGQWRFKVCWLRQNGITSDEAREEIGKATARDIKCIEAKYCVRRERDITFWNLLLFGVPSY